MGKQKLEMENACNSNKNTPPAPKPKPEEVLDTRGNAGEPERSDSDD
ncbi:hypothetical protein COLO4_35516 [Corchorus olitorius]|uniref:Uncharacterized protein n=1 Tax=Corchorus olitorius TaxID=93759 RepID=A0A1R3GFZ7_9ROSI|nr:hypothetical protein COLO4_35516 [Corchorus olitorius]